MHLKLTDEEVVAARVLLAHRATDIRSRPDAGYIALHLADSYDELRCHLESVQPAKRTGLYGVTLARDGAQRLETLIAHDGTAVLRSVLTKISQARRPKPDPRRKNARRVREAANA